MAAPARAAGPGRTVRRRRRSRGEHPPFRLFHLVLYLMSSVPQHTNCSGPHPEVICPEQPAQQGIIHLIKPPAYP
jgi:hypothetical protein